MVMGNNKKEFFEQMPFPICQVGEDGQVKYANSKIKEVFAYDDIIDSNFFALTGVKIDELEPVLENNEPEISGEPVKIERNDEYFALKAVKSRDEDCAFDIYFTNITEQENLKVSYKNEKICFIFISIDNYDELLSSITEDSKRAVPTEVDRYIRKWAEEFEASLDVTGEATYTMSVYRKNADKIIEDRFSILDQVGKIETKIDFPVSLSIGMGMGVDNLSENAELAEAALELAMGRGGDQAVVKNKDRTHYYGGKLQTMEKHNKGKSRIIAHALKQLMSESKNVIIMGHKWPDMDCFGAAIGAYKIAKYYGKEAQIVISDYNEALQEIYKQAKETEDYNIVGRSGVGNFANENSLVIVVDTHRPGMIEIPELLDIAKRKVVIDHHRLSEDAIQNAELSYVESYASSASELVTEILQYTAPKRIVNKFEAEALLAGITVDTNSFSIKTGVRTFEAAAWLRRAGADTTEVKRFFQTEVGSFQAKAEAIAKAEYLAGGIAMAISEGRSPDAQIINAQVADELLMVKGVRASFVMGENDRGKTVVSARSLGKLNVQVIMEKFGGGGHLSSAGAQVDISPEETKEKLKEIIMENNQKEKRNQ